MDGGVLIHTVSHVSLKVSSEMVTRALAHAAENGWSIAVSVVDADGATIASARMDGVSSQILGFADDKAFTASTMRKTTEAYFERMDQSASLRLGLANRNRLLVWGGGLPIKYKGAVIGGIGVSGAQDFEDVACAQVAIRNVGLAVE
jgi:uncharacterized protein GlcG (DUF336 family)